MQLLLQMLSCPSKNIAFTHVKRFWRASDLIEGCGASLSTTVWRLNRTSLPSLLLNTILLFIIPTVGWSWIYCHWTLGLEWKGEFKALLLWSFLGVFGWFIFYECLQSLPSSAVCGLLKSVGRFSVKINNWNILSHCSLGAGAFCYVSWPASVYLVLSQNINFLSAVVFASLCLLVACFKRPSRPRFSSRIPKPCLLY